MFLNHWSWWLCCLRGLSGLGVSMGWCVFQLTRWLWCFNGLHNLLISVDYVRLVFKLIGQFSVQLDLGVFKWSSWFLVFQWSGWGVFQWYWVVKGVK